MYFCLQYHQVFIGLEYYTISEVKELIKLLFSYVQYLRDSCFGGMGFRWK